MARRRRQARNFESYVDEAKQKIREKPQNALREIGKLLAREIRKNTPRSKQTRTYYKDGREITVKPGKLRRSIGYWYRKREGDLQIGSKSWYAHLVEFGSSIQRKEPFLVPTVMKHLDTIKGMIEDALKELTNDERNRT